MPARFNPDEDHAVIRGNPARAFIQNDWYYDVDGKPLEPHSAVRPIPPAARKIVRSKAARVSSNTSRSEPAIPESVRRAWRENALALAAERLGE